MRAGLARRLVALLPGNREKPRLDQGLFLVSDAYGELRLRKRSPAIAKNLLMHSLFLPRQGLFCR